MTKDAIIEAARRLSPEERHEIVEALWRTEEDFELTDEGKASIDVNYPKLNKRRSFAISHPLLKKSVSVNNYRM